jgi:small subunit ribosomal protein S21
MLLNQSFPQRVAIVLSCKSFLWVGGVEGSISEGEMGMAQVILGENEGIESALRRFKRQVAKAGIFQDMKKKRHFETPLEKQKRKAIAKRRQRNQRHRH